MEDWVHRAIARWPNVPALFGWLALDRRGRWLIQGEVISRPQIVETINRNYAADAHGRWYFQNGPQRGYMRLDYAPLVLRAEADGDRLTAHTGTASGAIAGAFIDEEGAVMLLTEAGPGLLADADLEWALHRLRGPGGEVDEDCLALALALPSGADTGLWLRHAGARLQLLRLDREQEPAHLGFVRDPQPLPQERPG